VLKFSPETAQSVVDSHCSLLAFSGKGAVCVNETFILPCIQHIIMSLISLHLITFVLDYLTFLRFSLHHTMTDVMQWTECQQYSVLFILFYTDEV